MFVKTSKLKLGGGTLSAIFFIKLHVTIAVLYPEVGYAYDYILFKWVSVVEHFSMKSIKSELGDRENVTNNFEIFQIYTKRTRLEQILPSVSVFETF